ncbi:MAG: tRNA (guanosine(46)-N7)-methyltransferase TrmB [Gammaproteobacteria bacterium RIFCSPHIGHO2_12_FULL_38_11]|nr:MAG: tRNA (guanosine(46)-N7)-methyltransferase TrmB [Gammaproteobacteria bacterium RIFCSPHIGHO2_12_FULL_38_11]
MAIIKREIKSFVKRQRRVTARLQKAHDLAWPQFGIIATEEKLNLNEIFNRNSEKICEIGFGHGDTLLPMAINNPDKDYLGIEVHEPGIAVVMMGIIENNLSNIRVIQNDAVKILQNNMPDHSFSRIHIYFPDPWPKKKHRKRRIIQPEFVQLLRKKLIPGGLIHCATDWEDYAKHMMAVLSEAEGFKNAVGDHQFADNEKLKLRENTKFEKRGVKLGHGVWDLLFII